MYDSFAQVSLLSSFFFLSFLSYFLSFSFLLFFLSSSLFLFLFFTLFFISYFGWAETKMDSTCITHLQLMSSHQLQMSDTSTIHFCFCPTKITYKKINSSFWVFFYFLSVFLLSFSFFLSSSFPFFFFLLLLCSSFLSFFFFFIPIYFVWAKTHLSGRTRHPCSCKSSHRVKKMYRKRH